MKKIAQSLSIAGLILSSQVDAEDLTQNQIWLGVEQNRYSYFDELKSEFSPQSNFIGYSRQFNDNWSASLSYAEVEEQSQWLYLTTENRNWYNHAFIDSSTLGVSLSWTREEHGLLLSYNQVDSDEASVTHEPTLHNKSRTDDQGLSLSYFYSHYFDALIVGWSVGLQYAERESIGLNSLNGGEMLQIYSQLEENSWSGFFDVDFTYWFENDRFAWAPQFTLSWSSEISSDQEIIGAEVINGELNRRGRFAYDLREPDSGFWEAGIILDWDSVWSSRIVFGKSLKATTASEVVSIDLSYVF